MASRNSAASAASARAPVRSPDDVGRPGTAGPPSRSGASSPSRVQHGRRHVGELHVPVPAGRRPTRAGRRRPRAPARRPCRGRATPTATPATARRRRRARGRSARAARRGGRRRRPAPRRAGRRRCVGVGPGAVGGDPAEVGRLDQHDGAVGVVPRVVEGVEHLVVVEPPAERRHRGRRAAAPGSPHPRGRCRPTPSAWSPRRGRRRPRAAGPR